MSKQMILYAATNNTGSECSTELDITETEWNALTEYARAQIKGMACYEFAADSLHVREVIDER